jgi:hypothetical protein
MQQRMDEVVLMLVSLSPGLGIISESNARQGDVIHMNIAMQLRSDKRQSRAIGRR